MILYNALSIGSERVDQDALAKPSSNPIPSPYRHLDATYWTECAAPTTDCTLEFDKANESKGQLIWRIFQKPSSK